MELNKAKQQLKETDASISAQKAEIDKLNHIINEADEERVRQKKEYDIVINERDILGAYFWQHIIMRVASASTAARTRYRSASCGTELPQPERCGSSAHLELRFRISRHMGTLCFAHLPKGHLWVAAGTADNSPNVQARS